MKNLQFRQAVLNFYFMYSGKINNIVNTMVDIFNISSSIIYVWRNAYNSTGVITSKKIGRPRNTTQITETIERYIVKRFVLDKCHNMKNIRRSIKRVFNISIKKSSVYRILKKNKITYKKISIDRSPDSLCLKKQKYEKLKKELEIVTKIPDNVISFDESYMSPENLERMYGWSKKGTKVNRKVNGKTYRNGKSMLLAITNKKTVAYKLIKGPVKGAHIRDFIMNDVIKTDTNKILFMDNASSHKNKQLRLDMEKSNNKIVFNVTYSPQTNPIEYINNVVKDKLKKQHIENIEGLESKLDKIVKKINEKIYVNCFRKAYECMTTD